MSSKVCPSRVLAEDPADSLGVVEWWLETTAFDGMSGLPAGPPEWPYPGGWRRQPAKLLAAVALLRSEWNRMADERMERDRKTREARERAARARGRR